MSDRFRIHGDNIVECERIAKLILKEIEPAYVTIALMSPSTIVYQVRFEYCGRRYDWQLELLPGYNKAGRRRWESDIFTGLKEGGSFLDETPDAIVTHIAHGMETILYAIEFCSALQAGNQAWQRSGRAFSTGRTGCPYLYIVDFVHYELHAKTRKRKTLRFPNPAVPYSYINFSQQTNHFVAQIYTRSAEFDKRLEPKLTDFHEANFASAELSRYIVKRMCGLDTSKEEEIILQKSLNIVMFLASTLSSATNFTPAQWKQLHDSQQEIIPFSFQHSGFNFHKKISAKSHHGNTPALLDLVDELSVGVASQRFPFGIIPAAQRGAFAAGLQRLYPSYHADILKRIASGQGDLILCIMKGFKPRGDDNRPDRGVLPLAAMLSSPDTEIMTYIYGPILERNLTALTTDCQRLASSNGFWRSILSLSNYLALDAPVLSSRPSDVEVLLDTSALKEHYIKQIPQCRELTQPEFSSVPQSFHEDDVDTGIHFLFSHLLGKVCFEGMCNPPGGDWSGLSILAGNREVRWLSLPRVSKSVKGKRPDHVLELFHVFDCPVLLSIESKERSTDLEPNVGEGLVNYIRSLMDYVPSVERPVYPHAGAWTRSKSRVYFHAFATISAAAYLRQSAQAEEVVFANSGCDMLFIMEPAGCGWKIEIAAATREAQALKAFICDKITKMDSFGITVF